MPYDEMKGADNTVRDSRFIEDDFKVLKEIDDQIQTLLNQRQDRVAMIQAQHRKNGEMIERESDWYHGVVMQQPVAERGDEPNEGPSRSIRY